MYDVIFPTKIKKHSTPSTEATPAAPYATQTLWSTYQYSVLLISKMLENIIFYFLGKREGTWLEKLRGAMVMNNKLKI